MKKILKIFNNYIYLKAIFYILFRDFLEHDLVDYASKNSGVVVYVKPRRHRTPVITAEYCKYVHFTSYMLQIY